MPPRGSARWRFIASLFSVLILVPPECALGTSRYRWVGIASLPAGSGIIHGLSDNGDVVGRSGYPHGTKTRAFVQTAGGTTAQICVLLGCENSRASVLDTHHQ